jgi:CRP-like cAMP-binding protein
VAFEGVRLTVAGTGEVVMAAGEQAGLVYIPLGPGLRVEPLGGYPPRDLPAWSPVGTTAVISGAPRNGTVIAEHPVELLMIPRDTYLRHWYRPYSLDEFIHQLRKWSIHRPYPPH